MGARCPSSRICGSRSRLLHCGPSEPGWPPTNRGSPRGAGKAEGRMVPAAVGFLVAGGVVFFPPGGGGVGRGGGPGAPPPRLVFGVRRGGGVGAFSLVWGS